GIGGGGEGDVLDLHVAALERLEPRDGAEGGRLAAPPRPHDSGGRAPFEGGRHPLAGGGPGVARVEVDGGGHPAARPRSRRRERRDSGKLMPKYSAAHKRPGRSHERTSTAVMAICLVSSTTVMTLTSALSLVRAMKSLATLGSARRKACGSSTRRSASGKCIP